LCEKCEASAKGESRQIGGKKKLKEVKEKSMKECVACGAFKHCRHSDMDDNPVCASCYTFAAAHAFLWGGNTRCPIHKEQLLLELAGLRRAYKFCPSCCQEHQERKKAAALNN